jgi:hypothetical protein
MTKHQSEPNAQPASRRELAKEIMRRLQEPIVDAPAQPPASEPSGREPAMPAGFREWLARAVDVAVSPKQAETVWHGFWRWEPGVPERECTTADMLRRLAMHLSSGALKFTEHDFDTGNWIAALNHRADLLEGRHPAAPAGEREEVEQEPHSSYAKLRRMFDNEQAKVTHFQMKAAALEASHAALQAKLDAFAGLVEKWRKMHSYWWADELAAALAE